MLLEFEVTNLLSFKNKNTFSMHSDFSRAEIFKGNTIFKAPLNKRKNSYVHNAAILYGPNASGKTNLFSAISFLKDIVKNSYKKVIKSIPFRFTDENNPSEIRVKFIQNLYSTHFEFNYQITIDRDGIISNESLVCYEILKTNKGPEQVVFIREADEFIAFHSDLRKLVEKYKINNIETKAALSFFIRDINKSYFKDILDTHGYNLLRTVYKFIVEKIVISGKTEDNSIAKKLKNNPFLKDKVIHALNEIDNSIEDFEIIDVTELISEQINEILNEAHKDEIPKNVLEKLKLINESKERVFDFKTIHKVEEGEYTLEYFLESAGTRKFIAEFIEIIDCLENDKVYIIDEIENHYHEYLQRYILNLFLNQDEGKTAQIIATTHSVEFLDPDRFAKEQIWFVEKIRSTQESFLYRLSDFKEVTYNNHNWKNLYLQGRLGAVPKVIM